MHGLCGTNVGAYGFNLLIFVDSVSKSLYKFDLQLDSLQNSLIFVMIVLALK